MYSIMVLNSRDNKLSIENAYLELELTLLYKIKFIYDLLHIVTSA